jgi:transposase InsO family protein
MSQKAMDLRCHDWQVRYDNAAMESFFATLKKELVYHQSYRTYNGPKRDIFYYIEV